MKISELDTSMLAQQQEFKNNYLILGVPTHERDDFLVTFKEIGGRPVEKDGAVFIRKDEMDKAKKVIDFLKYKE